MTTQQVARASVEGGNTSRPHTVSNTVLLTPDSISSISFFLSSSGISNHCHLGIGADRNPSFPRLPRQSPKASPPPTMAEVWAAQECTRDQQMHKTQLVTRAGDRVRWWKSTRKCYSENFHLLTVLNKPQGGFVFFFASLYCHNSAPAE